MKKSIKALIFISTALIVMNCANDEKVPLKGNVQFAIMVSAKPSDGGKVASVDLPDSAYVAISVETTSGVSVYSLKRMELIKLGDGFITAPIALTEGNYRLTDFMILSKHNEVLYATPKEGSSLASLVDEPLPVNFSITKDGILNMNVQVVSTIQHAPEDFGYVSFGIEIVGRDFSVSLFSGESNVLSLTSGKLELYQGNNLIYEQNLDAKVNAVNFKGDPYIAYTLVVQKEGYSIFHREYVLHDLIEELEGKPLAIFVVPALTFTVKNIYSTPPFQLLLIDFSGTSSNLTIDWGDGTVQHGIDFSRAGPMHGYGSPGKLFYINVYGDIDGISRIGCNYQLPVEVQRIDITSLTGLTDFVMVLTQNAAPKFIDFSRNLKLTSLDLDESSIERINISNNHLLSTLDVSGTALSEEQVGEIISHLHANATEHGIRQGFIAFVKNPFSGTPVPLVPLSEESKLKLIDLRDNYNWVLSPAIQ